MDLTETFAHLLAPDSDGRENKIADAPETDPEPVMVGGTVGRTPRGHQCPTEAPNGTPESIPDPATRSNARTALYPPKRRTPIRFGIGVLTSLLGWTCGDLNPRPPRCERGALPDCATGPCNE